MADGKGTRSTSPHRPNRTTPIVLTREEVNTLVKVSNYYGRGLTFMRRVIQAMSRGEMRAKAKFVHEESYWLRRFAEANRDRMIAAGESSAQVDFTPRALVAFYGRTLATLNIPRTRRRLSPAQISEREALAAKLQEAVSALGATNASLLQSELQTRRERERLWIEGRLGYSE